VDRFPEHRREIVDAVGRRAAATDPDRRAEDTARRRKA
jgi:hypothetical protein